MTVRDAAEALLQAEDALRDAENGLGHPGEPHNDDVRMGEPPNSVSDCSACGGAQYGWGDTKNHAMGDLREALGHDRLPWEYKR